MSRLIVSLSLLFFIAIVSIGGCDGGGMGDVIEPTPMPEPTPNPSEACSNCPCDFFSVPMTTGCWKSPGLASVDTGSDKYCFLSGPGTTIQVYSEYFKVCLIRFSVAHEFCGEDFHQDGLSNEELEACMDCLEDYATDLNDSGISVSGGPPYDCPL